MLDTHSAPRCINWRWRSAADAPFCGRWNCPLWWHGWPVREAAFTRHRRLLAPGDHYWTLTMAPNRRLHGPAVAKIIRGLRQTARRHFPGSASCVFVHAHGSSDSGLSPYPDLHLMLSSREGADAAGQGAVKQVITKALHVGCPRAFLGEWREVRCVVAHLRYLYRAEVGHKRLPADELPKSGDRYRQVYGRL